MNRPWAAVGRRAAGRRRAAVAAALLLAGLPGCGEPETPRALVLIVVDTLRADHVGILGGGLASTPHLDALARRGVRFTDAMTPVPVTLPAVTSLLTGRLPLQHGVRDNEGFFLPEEEITLAERFRNAGWRTAAVIGSAVLSADRGLARGFEIYDDDFEGPYPVFNPEFRQMDARYGETRRRADVVTERALRAAESFRGRDSFFLMVHYFDVHAHYDPPPRHAAPNPDRPYAGEVSFVDEQVGRLLDGLAEYDPTVVLVADHGEGLGEHGESQHGFLLYQSTLHVPVIAAGPGIPAGVSRPDPVSLVDLEPTLAAWFGLKDRVPRRDGRVLDWAVPEERPAPLYAETMRTLLSYGWSELRAVRFDDGKFISGPPDELYDLQNDPYELRDLGRRSDLISWRELLFEITSGEDRATVLAARRDEAAERREQLESLGYVAAQDDSGRYPHPRAELPGWSARQKRKGTLFRGLYALAVGRLREGQAVMDTLLAEYPEMVEAHYARAVARFGLKDTAGGEESLARALSLDPGNQPARALVAERDGHADAARAAWKESLLAAAHLESDPMILMAQTTPFPRTLRESLPALREAVRGGGTEAGRIDLAITQLRLGRRAEAQNTIRAMLRRPAADGPPRTRELRRVIEERFADR